MNIYIVVVNDRHEDLKLHSFSSKERAISEATRIAKDNCSRENDYYEYEVSSLIYPCIFLADYSCDECDDVSVIASEVNVETD